MDVSEPRKLPTLPELCLLIGSIFPEDFSIPVDDLVIYMMGLNLFKHVHYMIEARHLVYDIIYDLASHHMIQLCGENNNRLGVRTFDEDDTGWLPNELHREKGEYNNQYFKMLADGRDFAKHISSMYGLLFGRGTGMKNSLFRLEHVGEDKGGLPEHDYEDWNRLFEHEYEDWNRLSEQDYEDWNRLSQHDCEDYNGLSLVLKKASKYYFSADCPKLALLHLQHGQDSEFLPVGISKQLRNLQVLSLDIPSLTPSFIWPRNLRTLRLKVLKLEDMSWIGRLKYLEFLSVSTSSLWYVPEEMKQLRNLRLLDLRESTNLVYIPPGVFSRMLKLEELYLPLSYKRWGCRGKEDDDDCFESEEGEKINASFSEITTLSLCVLQISLQEASVLPKKTSFFKSIKRFRILVHNDFRYPLDQGRMNKLQLTGDACYIKQSGIWDLMQIVEDLSLIKVRNLKNVMSQLEEFPQLKKMIITKCDELEYLATVETWIPDNSFPELKYLHLSMLSNLKEIWYGTRPYLGLFENLRQISIRFCHKLKYVFRLSMVKGLSRLKSIEILDCNEMEGVFYGNELGDDNSGVVCCIEELHLYSLPKFVGFLANKDYTIEDGVLNDNNLSMTTNEIVSTSIESPNGAFDNDFQSFPTNESICRGNQVSRTTIKDADSLVEMYCAYSSKLMEKELGGLRKLKIAFCEGLQNLRHIWFQIPPKIMVFQNLQHLVLSECHNLYHVFSYRVAKLMVGLKKVQISRCEKMKEIVVKDDDEVVDAMADKISFFHLKSLELQHMPNLSFLRRV